MSHVIVFNCSFLCCILNPLGKTVPIYLFAASCNRFLYLSCALSNGLQRLLRVERKCFRKLQRTLKVLENTGKTHRVLLGFLFCFVLFCGISELLAFYLPKCVGYSEVKIYNPQIIVLKYHFKQKFNI